MQLEHPSVKTIEEVENPALRRVQYGSLIGLLGLLGCYFLLEYRGNGVAWTWMETYSVIPAMLFMGATLSGGMTRPVRNRLIFGAAFLIWFAVTKALHRIEGVEARSIGVFFSAYGMCLPFAWASGDGKRRRGLKWILGLYLGLGALLVLYGLMLLGGCVPGFLQDAVYWDGTRFSAMSHPNVCAPLLMIGIGVSLMCWGRLNKVWQRVLLILWIGLQFGVLILTSARTTIVFTCVLLGGSLFCALRKSGWKRFAIACLAAVVLMGGLFVGSQMLSKVHKTNMEASQTAGEIKNIQYGWGSDIKNLNNRTEIWSSARKGLRDNPRILLEGTEYSGLIISQYNSFRVYHAHQLLAPGALRHGPSRIAAGTGADGRRGVRRSGSALVQSGADEKRGRPAGAVHPGLLLPGALSVRRLYGKTAHSIPVPAAVRLPGLLAGGAQGSQIKKRADSISSLFQARHKQTGP